MKRVRGRDLAHGFISYTNNWGKEMYKNVHYIIYKYIRVYKLENTQKANNTAHTVLYKGSRCQFS